MSKARRGLQMWIWLLALALFIAVLTGIDRLPALLDSRDQEIDARFDALGTGMKLSQAEDAFGKPEETLPGQARWQRGCRYITVGFDQNTERITFKGKAQSISSIRIWTDRLRSVLPWR